MKRESVNKEKNKKVTTKKKKGVIKGIKSYFKGVKKEIGRIRWTSFKELVKYSITTIIFMLFFGLYFYLIDLVVALIRSIA